MLRNLTFVVLLYQTKERKRVTIFVLFFLFFWRNVWATFVTKSNLWLSLSNVWATFWGISGNFLWISSNLQKALPRPHCAGEIWKLSFISMVRPTAHTNPSRKRNFSKTLFRSEEFEKAALRFSVEGKHFENRAVRKRWRHENHWWDFPAQVFLKHKSKETGDCCVFKFSGVVQWTANYCYVFRVKTPFSKFSGV